MPRLSLPFTPLAALGLTVGVAATPDRALPAPRPDGKSRPEIASLVQQILDAHAPGLGDYGALRAATTRADMRRLREHRNEGIAVWAAWQEVRRTVPEEEGPTTYRPDRRKIEWFLAVLECRVRADAPDWWRTTVRNAWANRRDNFVFGTPVRQLYHASGPGSVMARHGTSLRSAQGVITLASGADSVPVPAGVIETEGFSARRYLSALFVPARCYVAAHEETGSKYRLTCLTRPSGKVRWRTEVWGARWGGFSGRTRPDHCVTVIEQGDRILVFGAATWGAYVEAFRAADGRNLFRFSTSD
jgi:hypothetical protein